MGVMILHKNSLFSIYFGDNKEKFMPAHFVTNTSKEILIKAPFNQLKKVINIQDLVFLHQVHGVQGVAFASKEQMHDFKLFTHDGDYLITALPYVGLGVATADCLPIIIYDSVNQVIANVHAGWRGSVGQIVVVAVQQMISSYCSELQNLQFFFGPCAKVCCYEIKEDILLYLKKFPYFSAIVRQHDERYMLDVPLLNRLQLEGLGVKRKAIHTLYNFCTMCDPSFCSFRRSKNAERQMTIVVLTL